MLHTAPALLSPGITTEPFSQDSFNRKPLAENLTRFLATFHSQSFVLGMHGKWGSGKTTLVQMWQEYLRQEGFTPTYFNAWENDHSDDPLPALFACLSNLGQKSSGFSKKLGLLRKVTVDICKRAPGGVIKHLTMGAVDVNADLENMMGELADKAITETISLCEKSQQLVTSFKKALEEAVKSATQKKPLFFFIDELDRCRPTYALSVLERIKHLMGVPGIVFVLAWDKEQIGETIRTIYGTRSDPAGYLRRLVDMEFTLPAAPAAESTSSLLERFQIDSFLKQHDTSGIALMTIQQVLIPLVQHLHLTLRDQERVFTLLTVYLRLTKEAAPCAFIGLAVLLSVLRVKEPILLSKVSDLQQHWESLLHQDLPQLVGTVAWSLPTFGYIYGLLLGSLSQEALEPEILRLRNKAGPMSREWRDQAVIGVQASHEHQGGGAPCDWVLATLDFGVQFT